MLATIINAVAILIGGIAGIVFRNRISEQVKTVIFVAAGVTSLVIGISMALKVERVLYFAVALVGGGLIGALLRIEDGVLWLGEKLRGIGGKFGRRKVAVPDSLTAPSETGSGFARGFLEASVLFCVGAMAILGSIEAGTAGPYGPFPILLTKSVMDGFISILLAAALGAGVIASALSILIYQGLLTLGAGLLSQFISPLMVSMISAVGGAMVIMIGINLLGLKKIPTANFLPGIVIAVALAAADPWMPQLFKG